MITKCPNCDYEFDTNIQTPDEENRCNAEGCRNYAVYEGGATFGHITYFMFKCCENHKMLLNGFRKAKELGVEPKFEN